ncbi:signal recognition particle-docking protein FtsY [Haloarcula onubensis]|uniref:Signal recognition particle receptor FtsY n=1 Tax=Haloarcula onubensis TaxID=2950539 RepID=A0ABU2FN15_9EURY|nr:signal recognition particle-docking protein FtsY [Halomicroarcula sp. S3CR25-11]MDS0282160.1 signal recognition particle-docking protein FtsY [Halomicroarcula sp. S3CR25-11]
MFDGLKDKLSSFRSDVEEDVDEEAVEEDEPGDAEATPEEADAPEAESAADAETADAESVPEDSTDSAEHTPEGGPGEETVEPAAKAAATPETPADTAEEPPEPVGEGDDESEADADEAATVEADTESTDASEADAAEADEDADADDEADAAEADAAEADEDADADDEADAAEADEDDDGGRSFTEKAKIMATGKTVIEEADLQTHLDDLELALLSSDVEMSVANEILSGVEANLTGQTRRRLSSTGNLVRDALREALFDVISVGQFDFDERVQEADKPVVIIFTGVNGVGKTTTIAKLSRYFEDRGRSTVLANGDTYRAGANEQLEKHAENLGKKIITHEQGSDPTAVVYDAVEYAKANDVDVVLGDTAGRLHTSDDLMAQLEKIDRNIDPDMTLFVDEAVAGQDAVNRAREFDDAAEIDGAILTKADADPQGGAAISVAHVTGKPILFLGTGQDYDDLEPFDPEEIVDSLFDE